MRDGGRCNNDDNPGARYQIAVDGQPRTNRDDKLIALKTAEYLKHKNPHSEITVYDRESGETVTLKMPPPGRWMTGADGRAERRHLR